MTKWKDNAVDPQHNRRHQRARLCIDVRKDDVNGTVESADECPPEPDGNELGCSVKDTSNSQYRVTVTLGWCSVAVMTLRNCNKHRISDIIHCCRSSTIKRVCLPVSRKQKNSN